MIDTADDVVTEYDQYVRKLKTLFISAVFQKPPRLIKE
jgi:hypothetical protein